VNRHALSVLELDRVLNVVAAGATSELGAERVRALAPTTDRAWIEREHARIAAIRALKTAETPWHPEPVPDVRAALERLRIVGLAWSAPELHAAHQLLRSGRRTRESLSDAPKAAS
jgi:DNA mismatch repair protein MutS2